MMKTKILMTLMPVLCGCVYLNGYQDEYQDTGVPSLNTACPVVQIKDEDKAIIQKAGDVELFKIEITGYDGSCYYDERLYKDKAVVAPHFKITRLAYTNVEDVHFSYYMQTAEGPSRFLGKKTYFAEVRMPKGAFESRYTPSSNELSIPAGEHDIDMYIGLNAVKADSEYKIK